MSIIINERILQIFLSLRKTNQLYLTTNVRSAKSLLDISVTKLLTSIRIHLSEKRLFG